MNSRYFIDFMNTYKHALDVTEQKQTSIVTGVRKKVAVLRIWVRNSSATFFFNVFVYFFNSRCCSKLVCYPKSIIFICLQATSQLALGQSTENPLIIKLFQAQEHEKSFAAKLKCSLQL